MLAEYKVLLNELVAVTRMDQFIGSVDKWQAHTNKYITGGDSNPHRAFSIFLFNKENQLMFQRRSADKKTFPLCWTNTCCSHPNMVMDEQTKQKKVENIRDALHRALHRQLRMDLKAENFYLVDKICYKAEGRENEEFGEFEVDYVFLCKVDTEPKYEMISEEVCEVAWVPRNGMEEFLETKKKEGCLFSPWFMKMYNNGLLFKWWDEVAVSKLVNPPSDAELPVREL